MHYSGSLKNCYLHARERGGKYDETFKIIQFPWILSVSVFDDDPQKTRRLRPLLVNNQQGQTILNLAFEDPGIYVYTVYMYILNIYIRALPLFSNGICHGYGHCSDSLRSSWRRRSWRWRVSCKSVRPVLSSFHPFLYQLGWLRNPAPAKGWNPISNGINHLSSAAGFCNHPPQDTFMTGTFSQHEWQCFFCELTSMRYWLLYHANDWDIVKSH